mgnify:CR=1 FL=1
MVVLADTHCHLDFSSFDPDREMVLERAWRAGISRILVPGVDLASSRKAVILAVEHPQIFAAVGVHPNDAEIWKENSIEELLDLASQPKVIAIGEIGLDYYRERSPKDIQIRIFSEQLMAAKRLELPVIIHNRQASEDILRILSDWSRELSVSGSSLLGRLGVLHSFSDNLDIALRAIDLGFYIGFTGPVTYKNADELRQVAARVPLDKILIETDAPFLAPQPKRGMRNEPAFVYYVAEKLSEIRQLPLEEVAAQLKANTDTLFRW